MEISEIIRNYALVIIGITGLIIAIWRAIAADRQSKAQRDQVTQARREHVAELFAKAVENLDSEKLHVRLGAIHTLREIVESFPELSKPTMDLMVNYLKQIKYENDEPPVEVRAIMLLVASPLRSENVGKRK